MHMPPVGRRETHMKWHKSRFKSLCKLPKFSRVTPEYK